MGADAPADGGEGVVPPDEAIGVLIPARGGQGDVAGDVDAGRTGLLAGRDIALFADAGPHLDRPGGTVHLAASAADTLVRIY